MKVNKRKWKLYGESETEENREKDKNDRKR